MHKAFDPRLELTCLPDTRSPALSDNLYMCIYKNIFITCLRLQKFVRRDLGFIIVKPYYLNQPDRALMKSTITAVSFSTASQYNLPASPRCIAHQRFCPSPTYAEILFCSLMEANIPVNPETPGPCVVGGRRTILARMLNIQIPKHRAPLPFHWMDQMQSSLPNIPCASNIVPEVITRARSPPG